MLAVQRPSMGSSKPPNLEMPFGYSFDTSTSNYPFPSPPAPAPGPSLLDDSESKFLDSFFDGVSSDQFNYDFFNNGPDGSELGHGWEELPPEFMGASSSFGQQPQMGAHGLSGMNYGGMNTQMNTGSILPAPTSADILAAATLLQNGASGRSFSMADTSMLRNRENQMQAMSGPTRAQSMSQPVSRLQPGFQPQPNGDEYMRDTFATDMIYGSQFDPAMRHRGHQKVDIRWGSDAAFGSPQQGFMAPPGLENPTTTERNHIHTVENALSIGTLIPSTDSTRTNSPIAIKSQMAHQRSKSLPENDEEEQDSRPRKRRKSKFQEDDEEDEDFQSPTTATTKQSTKKRKSIKKEPNDIQPADTPPGHKRKKSTGGGAAAAKATRENLTEEQKRENHIKSEQKRRTLIREGFEDLGELVPGLRGGGFSKSAVLIMAADWLEDLIRGNEELNGRIDLMEGRS